MSSSPLQVGITGGIGAGKSLVCRIFKVLGVPVYDADSRAKHLMNFDSELMNNIKELFGEEAYVEGAIDRTYIAKAAFGEPGLLKKLNALVHPRVGDDYQIWVQENRKAAYTLKEAALLFESGSYTGLDKVIMVTAPEDVRISRVLVRDSHRTEEDVRKIIAKQMSEDEKLRKADLTIHNDGSELVIPQVLKIHQDLSNKA